MSFKETIYLDSVSSSKTSPIIMETYKEILNDYYANSSSIHKLGVQVSQLETKSQNQILKLLNIKNYRLIFTSGATEANNIAIKSYAIKNAHLGRHLITSKIEHPSVYESFKFLSDYLNFEVTYLNVDNTGQIDLKELKNSLRCDTILVSIMSVNNEIGTIINPQKWAKIVKANSKAVTHSDMVQALGKIELCFDDIDMASFSSHKIAGVNGSGFLLLRDHLEIAPLISGGLQQDGLRAGTPNSPANIVLAKTVRLALENLQSNNLKFKVFSEYLYKQLAAIKHISLNSFQNAGVYNIINFSVAGVESEIMMNALSNEGIYVSAGSTCLNEKSSESRVLKAIGRDVMAQRTRIRISLDENIEMPQLVRFIEVLKEIIDKYAI